MARRKKKNLGNQLKKHQSNLKKQNDLKDRIDSEDKKVLEALANAPSTEGVKTSAVDQQAAPNVADELAAQATETKKEATEGLGQAEATESEILEGDKLNQWQAEYNAFSETEAAVEDGATKPHPEPTVGEEEAEAKEEKGVETSVVDQQAAPNVADELAADVPEDKKEAGEGLAESEATEAGILEGDKLNQWQAEYNAFSETEAAVEDGATEAHPEPTVGEEEAKAKEEPAKEEKGVVTSVVDQQAAPNVADMLAADASEDKKEAGEGLAEAEATEAGILEGDKLNQWQAEYNAFSETEAAVEAGATEPHPEPTVGEQTSKIPGYTLVGDWLEITKYSGGLDKESPDYRQKKDETIKEHQARVLRSKIKDLSKELEKLTGVKINVVEQQAAPDVSDQLRSEVIPTKEEAQEGLEDASATVTEVLEGDTIDQWQAQSDVFSQTNAAVDAGATDSVPDLTVGELEDLGLNEASPEDINKVVYDDAVSGEKPTRPENGKLRAKNHPIEKELPIYLL